MLRVWLEVIEVCEIELGFGDNPFPDEIGMFRIQ